MIISQITPSDVESVSLLVRRVFDAHVAELYPLEGCSEFHRFIEPAALAAGLGSNLRGFVAREDAVGGEPVGVLVLKDAAHISLFFVETGLQRRGVGRRLLDRAAVEAAAQGFPGFSVNASPNSVVAYFALGFVPAGPQQEKNGITFVPMVRTLADYQAARGGAAQPDAPLPGPAAFLVSGYDADARRDMSLFLGLLLDREPQLRPVSAEALERTVDEVLRAAQTADPLAAERLPRVVLFAGITLPQARGIVEHWKATGLSRPIFAVATEHNLRFSVGDLFEHLMEEHRALAGQSQGAHGNSGDH